MERGYSLLEVIVISAIICITGFTGLEILFKTINLKNQSSLNLFLTFSAEEKMKEIKGIIKEGKNLREFEDFLKDPFTHKKVFREWELKEKGGMVEIKVTAFTGGKRVEITDYFWKKGGF